MARKRNQPKNGIDHHSLHPKKRESDSGLPNTDGRPQVGKVKVCSWEEHPNGYQTGSPSVENGVGSEHTVNEKKRKQKSQKYIKKEKHGSAVASQDMDQQQPMNNGCNLEDEIESTSNMAGTSGITEHNLPSSTGDKGFAKSSLRTSLNGFPGENCLHSFDFSSTQAYRSLRHSTLSILQAASDRLAVVGNGSLRTSAFFMLEASREFSKRLNPIFIALKTNLIKARDHVRMKFEVAYPVVLRWLMHFGNLILLLLMVWMDCSLRGIGSFIRMGTTSFFSVIWCSIFSVIAMSGIVNSLVVLATSSLIGIFFGFTLASLVIVISGTVSLWLYGSFWTTVLIIFTAGLAFLLSSERLALLIATMYSLYSAWTCVGWIGLLLNFNLSFISSDVLIYFLKSNMNDRGRPHSSPEQTAGMQGQPGLFYNDPMHASSSEMGLGQSADRSSGVPSTSGGDVETTSEDEVLRLLSCTDHYAALGFSRFEAVDASLLKREYKKKAMLVHPDKNMGNEEAAEAFKRLQNAYEVLLDSLKRQVYDDELRREELMNYFRRFQSSSQKNGGHRFFSSGFARSKADNEDILGDSRQIACKKCGNFHIWIHTKKSKSQARWCQDCNDFHQAKDGDGWVEQSSQPFLFGLLQKVDVPSVYVCAESHIYDATDWYICQGMRCPANTHKPSFQVNTSVTPKHCGKGTSSRQRGGGMPTFNAQEGMTEEELYEWLQNAMQSGMFGSSTASSPSKADSCFRSSGGDSSASGGNNSSSKRKKKGKKPR